MKDLTRLMIRWRLCFVRLVCYVLLPHDLWVGKHFGVYTCKWNVVFGKMDERGVLQGITNEVAIRAVTDDIEK